MADLCVCIILVYINPCMWMFPITMLTRISSSAFKNTTQGKHLCTADRHNPLLTQFLNPGKPHECHCDVYVWAHL